MHVLFDVWLLSITYVCVAILFWCLYVVNIYVNYLSAAVSGIPSSTWPFPGTTKNIHLFLLSLKLMFTTQVPNCVMTVLLYVFNCICLLLVFLSFGFCNVFKQPFEYVPWHYVILTPCIYLYGTIILLLSAFVSNSAVNSDWFLFICTASILTVSILPSLYSWDVSTSISFTAPLLLLWHTFLKCPVLPHATHIFLYAGYCLGRCTLPQYWCGCHYNIWPTGSLAVSSFALFNTFIFLNCLNSVSVFNTTVCTLCASTLFA